ncbi:hypothetical protein ACFV3R_28460 [Streptomyces sp. NPDC059740]|uniref:hypothetical protein n=1 Tax=Streptomyces sp. NPDC059740 TaxID=3346926 RepID=UPI0036579F7E
MRHVASKGRRGRRSSPLLVLLVLLPLLQVLFAGAAPAGPVTGTGMPADAVAASVEVVQRSPEHDGRATAEPRPVHGDLRRVPDNPVGAAPFLTCRAPAWHHRQSPATAGGTRAAFSPAVRGWWHPLPGTAASPATTRAFRAPATTVRSTVLRC